MPQANRIVTALTGGLKALRASGLVQEIVKAKGGTIKGRKDQLITRIVALQKGKQKA